jgi:hypothetical protein
LLGSPCGSSKSMSFSRRAPAPAQDQCMGYTATCLHSHRNAAQCVCTHGTDSCASAATDRRLPRQPRRGSPSEASKLPWTRRRPKMCAGIRIAQASPLALCECARPRRTNKPVQCSAYCSARPAIRAAGPRATQSEWITACARVGAACGGDTRRVPRCRGC